jgi:hypothetical protein
VSDFYLFCKKNNRRLEFNDTGFFWSFVSIKEANNGYKGSGGHVFVAKYNFNYPVFSLIKILFSFIFFVKSGLTPLQYLLPIQIAFFSRLSSPSRTPKQQTVE